MSKKYEVTTIYDLENQITIKNNKSGNISPILRLEHPENGDAYISLDDGCIQILIPEYSPSNLDGLFTKTGAYKATAWIFPDAAEVIRSLLVGKIYGKFEKNPITGRFTKFIKKV